MQYFKMAAPTAWETLGAGEPIEFTQGDKATKVTVEFIADGPCAIFAQTRAQSEEKKHTLVAYVEGGKFEVEVTSSDDLALWPQMEADVTVQYKTNRRDQMVNSSGGESFTQIAPKRRQNDSMYQMTQVMNLNNAIRDQQFQKMLVERDVKWAKQLAKYDTNGDGVLDDDEKAAKKADKKAKKADKAPEPKQAEEDLEATKNED